MQCSYRHQPKAVCVRVGPDYFRPMFRLCEVCPQQRRQINKLYTYVMNASDASVEHLWNDIGSRESKYPETNL